MGWTEAMNRMLPSVAGKSAHITSGYGVYRSVGTTPHVGIDFNYVGGQTGINLTYPNIYAPVTGTVSRVGGKYGIIRIEDGEGYYHDILHTEAQNVKVGDHVDAGSTIIGTMGGRGAMGIRHVHYQIIKDKSTVNPEEYWNTKDSARPPDRPLEWDLRLTPADDFTLRGYLPDECFLAGTAIFLADGQQKGIEHISAGDIVMAFSTNERGGHTELVPKRVIRTFTNISQRIINLSLESEVYCTGGHVFLAGELMESGGAKFATISSIMRSDGTIVTEDAVRIRARTGAKFGSNDDQIVRIVYRGQSSDCKSVMMHRVLVRAGIPLPATTMSDGISTKPIATLAQHLAAFQIGILPDGSLRAPDGTHHDACNWPEGSTPFDSREALNWIVEADERPFTPPWIRELIEEDEQHGLRVAGDATMISRPH